MSVIFSAAFSYLCVIIYNVEFIAEFGYIKIVYIGTLIDCRDLYSPANCHVCIFNCSSCDYINVIKNIKGYFCIK